MAQTERIDKLEVDISPEQTEETEPAGLVGAAVRDAWRQLGPWLAVVLGVLAYLGLIVAVFVLSVRAGGWAVVGGLAVGAALLTFGVLFVYNLIERLEGRR
jgi:hypothetical protein